MRYEKTWLLLLLLCVFLPRATFVFRQDEGILAVPIVDDGYYNLTLARNVAAGKGFTFDGTSVTTGFHPLVVLTTAPVFALFGGGTTEPLRVILALYTAAGLVLAWMLYCLVRRLGGPGPALAAVLLYATSPATGILVNTLNGCDTVFGGLLLVGAVWYYLARVRGEADPPATRYLALGILAGSLGLARLDLGFFAALLGLDLLGVRLRRRPLRPGRLVLFGAGGLVMITPWILLNLSITGRPLPDNGRAVTLISRAAAEVEVRYGVNGLLKSFGGGPPPSLKGIKPYPEDRPPAAFYRTMVGHAGLSVVRETPHTGIAVTWGALLVQGLDAVGLGAWGGGLRSVGFPLVLGLLLAAATVLFLLLRRRRLAGLGPMRGALFLLPACLLVFLAYPLVVFGQWFFGRYYFPLVVVALIFTPVWARLVCSRWTPGRIAALVVVFFGAFLLDSGPGLLDPAPRNFYLQARHIRERLKPDAVVGAIQAGHVGFFCPQRVVNLDGKVNGEAHEALKARRVLHYARSRGVRFISEWPVLLDLLILQRSTPRLRKKMLVLEPENDYGWETYLFLPD